MEKVILGIYDLLGEKKGEGDNDPKKCVQDIFDKLDKDQSGILSKQEFVDGCLGDKILMGFLAKNV